MNKQKRSLAEIHLAVLLFGLAGIFAKLISLPSPIIVLGRVFFSSLFLLLIIFRFKIPFKLKAKKDYYYLGIMGIILALHWTAFFQSIQLSTVAIGLLTFAIFPVFVTFLEPYFFKEEFEISNIIVALITFAGVALVIPKFSWSNQMTQGVIWGLVSGLTYAILSMLNRKYVQDYPSSLIAFYEQGIGLVVLIPFLFTYEPVFILQDILLLALLGVVFTGIAHTLFIKGLKHIRTQVAGIISSLEPVYGILLAVFLIGEIPSPKEIIGGLIILTAALYITAKSK